MAKITIRSSKTGIAVSLEGIRDIAHAEDTLRSYLRNFYGEEMIQESIDALDEKGAFDLEVIGGLGDPEVLSIRMEMTDNIMAEAAYDESDPVYLYVIMRNDLESLVGKPDVGAAGRAAAQSGHAANQMVYEARQKNDPDLNALLHHWEQETGVGFGTQIVLGAPFSVVKQAVSTAIMLGHHAGIVHDPTYPLRDGSTVHLIPVDTCGYVFGKKNDLRFLLGHLPLLP